MSPRAEDGGSPASRSVRSYPGARRSMSLARAADAANHWPADAIEAYVALEEAVDVHRAVRDGVLVAARDSPGGMSRRCSRSCDRARRSRRGWPTRSATSRRDGGSPGDIGQVCVCGGLPELRSMTAAADGAAGRRSRAARLAVRDRRGAAARAGGRISRARRRAAARVGGRRGLAGADQPAARAQPQTSKMLARAAVAAGIAAGLVIGWRVQSLRWSHAAGDGAAGTAGKAAPARVAWRRSRASRPAAATAPLVRPPSMRSRGCRSRTQLPQV